MTAPARANKAAARTGTAGKTANSGAATGTREDTAKKKTATKTRGSRTAAAERAYTRREERRDRAETPERRPRTQRSAAEQRQSRPLRLNAVRPKARQLQAKVVTSRVPMVVGVMALLGGGLVATLSLSIATVGNSYRLQESGKQVTALNEQRETLVREVSNMDSTPALQRKAAELGMVPPPGPPAHLLVHPDGRVDVIGQPQEAVAPKPPAPPAPPAAPPATSPAVPPQQVRPPEPHPVPQRQAATIPAVEGR